MSEYTTIARPYAKAVFSHALAADKLELWSQLLEGFTMVCTDEQAEAFLENPISTVEERASLFKIIPELIKADDEAEKAINFTRLLAENRRIDTIPEITRLYAQLRADYEKTLEVTVRTFKELSDAQKNKLVHSLEKRLQRKIKLNEVLDESLLGGAVVQAGDLVIDGSVKGKLNKLAAGLAA